MPFLSVDTKTTPQPVPRVQTSCVVEHFLGALAVPQRPPAFWRFGQIQALSGRPSPEDRKQHKTMQKPSVACALAGARLLGNRPECGRTTRRT